MKRIVTPSDDFWDQLYNATRRVELEIDEDEDVLEDGVDEVEEDDYSDDLAE